MACHEPLPLGDVSIWQRVHDDRAAGACAIKGNLAESVGAAALFCVP